MENVGEVGLSSGKIVSPVADCTHVMTVVQPLGKSELHVLPSYSNSNYQYSESLRNYSCAAKSNFECNI